MQRIGTEADVFHAAAVNAAGNLVGTLKVALEHQLAATSDQHSVHIGIAGREPVSHPT